MDKGASIKHVRVEGVGRGNLNITVDQSGRGGGLIQYITYIFFAKFLNL